MESKILTLSLCIGVTLLIWQTNAAPAQESTDRDDLRRTLTKLDEVLNELKRRTEKRQWGASSNPDGPLPYRSLQNKKQERPTGNPESGADSLRSSNPDGRIPYRSLDKKIQDSVNPTSSSPERQGWDESSNPDGPVPYRSLKSENREGNLRKVLRYLLEMEDKIHEKKEKELSMSERQNPDGRVPYRSLKRSADELSMSERQNPDGRVPYRSLKRSADEGRI